MAIREDKKLAMIHITKTGGVSLCNALGMVITGHHNNYELYKKDYPDYFTFAVTRNPYERFISAFFYMKFFDETYPEKARYSHIYENGMKTVMYEIEKRGTALLKKQSWFICEGNNIMVDKVFRNPQDAFDFISKKFDIEGELKVENTSPHKYYDEYYDDELMDLVYKYYKKDFKIFGYGK